MSSAESWIYLNDKGEIILHVENDGHRFLRYGAEASDEVVTLEQLKQFPQLYEEALELLRERQA